MSGTPEPAAPSRRRSSVVYDPARDVFQPTPDALTTLMEEKSDLTVAKEVPQQAVTSSTNAEPASESPSSKQIIEASNKSHPSPSSSSKRKRPDDSTVSPLPGKKRRSSVTEQALQSARPKILSRSLQQTGGIPTVKPTSTSDRSPDSRDPNPRSVAQSKSARDGETSSINTRSPESRHKRRSSTDRTHVTERNDQRNGDKSRPPISRQRHQNGDRHTPPPRRSRTRSPIRRRSPNSSTRSAYGRRDPPPPRRRSRSPSPIRRSPPREDQSIRRPGGGTGRGRNVLAVAQRLAEEREREQEAQNAQIQRERGVQHMSNQFYNARPEWVKERGRDWRKNESKIKGLRNFNNWIKSCVIQKFSPEEAPQVEELGWGEEPKAPAERKPLLVLDIGCGKGGDLGKWQLAPQTVGLYVGLDPADQSIKQAHSRYTEMRQRRKPIFDAQFHVKDCFGEWIGDIPIIKEVGIDPNAGNGGPSKWSGGGFDVVTMMFSMHYAFESEHKARTMLRNVAGSLKKGGRFIGVVPNSDAIAQQVVKWCTANKNNKHAQAGAHTTANTDTTDEHTTTKPPNPDPATRHVTSHDPSPNEPPHWGNPLYTVRFGTDRPIPHDGIFRDPPFGWKYMFWMEEAVDVPEYVVPWEAFRAVAEGFNLEQRYRKPFLDVWEAEKDGPELSQLSVRMGVRDRQGAGLAITQIEREAVGFYHAFCFVKV